MDFVTLYGTELDRELGSADRDVLFTTARRKAAVNAGQAEFVKRTECVQRQHSLALVDGTQEYDLDAVSDFAWISRQGLSIKIVSGSTTRYIEGDDIEETTVERLSQEEPNWRAVSAGTPTHRYLRRDGASVYLGLHPAPDITGSDTWTALIGYVPILADMSADGDQPFSVTTAVSSLRPWHRALVHYAAHDLEKLRKNWAQSGIQLQLFEKEVTDFLAQQKPKQGQTVRFAHRYRGRRAMPSWTRDPRYY